jgi:hypothetical protein
MSLAPILYIGFSRLDVVPDPAERVHSASETLGMALITGCLGVTAACFYEIYEWVVDNWFAQHLFIGETDTITDLADGFLGPRSAGSSSASGRSPATRAAACRASRATSSATPAPEVGETTNGSAAAPVSPRSRSLALADAHRCRSDARPSRSASASSKSATSRASLGRAVAAASTSVAS